MISRLSFPGVAIAMAAALQIAATLPIGDYGIRVALSDLILPFAILAIIYISWQERMFPVNLRVAGAAWWFCAITAAMTVALVVGYRATGEIGGWALVNKYFGWFMLMGYFAAGAALAGLGGAPARDRFLDWFLIAAAWTAGLGALAYPLLFHLHKAPVFVADYRLTGLFQNSNAFGFLLAVAFCLYVATRPRRRWWLIPPAYLCGIWFSGSRGAVLAAVVGAVALAFARRDTIRPMLGALIVAALAAGAITAATLATLAGQEQGRRAIGSTGSERTSGSGRTTLQERKQMTQDALAMFGASPWFGAGLGTFAWTVERTATDRNAPRTIHNSALWLLTEFGIVGAAPMIGFLLACLIAFWLARGEPISAGMFAVAAAFMAGSLASEFLYQRHLWFLLGFTLAIPQPRTGPA